jgi:hypothetical protein
VAQQFCTQNYGTVDRLTEAQAFVQKRLSAKAVWQAPASLSYTVIGDRRVISRKAGLGVGEIKLASEAAHYIEGLGYPLWYAVVSDQYSAERLNRSRFRRFKSDLARAQHRSGLPACCYLEILEAYPAVHSNILFPLGGPKAQRLIDGLLRSEKFPGDTLHISEARGADWFVAYCSAERVTQARYVGVGRLAKRLPGSHPLGAGGGDRVRLSKALKDQLLEEGLTRPYRQHYAARSLPKIRKTPNAASGISPSPFTTPDPNGLFGSLPDEASPPRDWMRTSSRRPKLAIPGQYALELEDRPSVIDLMLRLGSTHAEIGKAVGLSRPQTTNVINGQFGASRRVVRRVLELATAA